MDDGSTASPASILTPFVLVGLDPLDGKLQQNPSPILVSAIAQRLAQLADQYNFLIDIVTQLQPGELGVLISFVGGTTELELLTHRILMAMAEPFQTQTETIQLNPSLGVALYPSHTRDINQLEILARQALMLARRDGGNCYRFYCEDQDQQFAVHALLSTCMDWVLERGDFQTYYQPQFELTTGKLVGAEALIRWRHPKWGILSPGKFIEIAEETGSIVSLGQWVLRQACHQAKQWQAQVSSPFKISINLSARQLDEPHLADTIAAILSETGLAASTLELELTESALMQNIDRATRVMQELKALGIRLAIDDFGVGYSSLRYLQTNTFDIIKIDRSFISRVDKNPVNASITTAVINLAHDLNLCVVGEGVETPAERDFLLAHQCDIAQGYYFGRPMPREHFIDCFH